MIKGIPSAVLPALLCVWIATAPAASDRKLFRVDALQENYEQFTLEPPAEEPATDIFSTCYAASRTIDAKLASIEIGGTEYIRYVPDAARIALDYAFVDAPATAVVTSITGCASAAKTEGATMFKYGGGTNCKLSMAIYDMSGVTVCEENKTDAVFVLKV